MSETPTSFAFEYTRTPNGLLRPLIRVALGYAGRETPPVSVQLDTGSDRCMFDHELPLLLGLNAYESGSTATVVGIGGPEEIALFPIELRFPDLDDAAWTVTAQFAKLPSGLNGLLGHAGFLGRMRACFDRAGSFELSEIRR